MKFDLYLNNPPADEARRCEEAAKTFSRELEHANQLDPETARRTAARKRVSTALAEWGEWRDKISYHTNNGAMDRLRNIMAQPHFNMAFDLPKNDIPVFPRPKDYGLTADEAYEDEPDTDAKLAFAAEVDRVLRWHGPEQPGIPTHKFSSNDGWIVTAAECESAVALWERAGQPIPDGEEFDPDRWSEFVAFLRKACRCGGFTV